MRCIQRKDSLRKASAPDFAKVIYDSLWERESGSWAKTLHELGWENLWMPL